MRWGSRSARHPCPTAGPRGPGVCTSLHSLQRVATSELGRGEALGEEGAHGGCTVPSAPWHWVQEPLQGAGESGFTADGGPTRGSVPAHNLPAAQSDRMWSEPPPPHTPNSAPPGESELPASFRAQLGASTHSLHSRLPSAHCQTQVPKRARPGAFHTSPVKRSHPAS